MVGMKRVQFEQILRDLKKKMVLLAGPRQVGKTFLAKAIAEQFKHPVYLNFDAAEDRKIIQTQAWLDKTDLLILDELHKMPDWKNYLKGIYDTKLPHQHILVTGSARLELFSQVGDSLAGRYYLHRLMPLSAAELTQLNQRINLDDLIHKSGFPEPYFAENSVEVRRWRQQYIHSLLSTDVFDYDKLHNLKALQNLFELLRLRVGSTISYQSLAEDLQISSVTVKKYIAILESVYLIFKITPYTKNIARSLLKEPKIYFFDTGLVKSGDGAQLENLVANALLKHVYAEIDYFANDSALHYLRTKEGKETDFALVKDNKIIKLIEVKNSEKNIDKSLLYFHDKYQIPAIQVVKSLRQEYQANGIEVLRLQAFLEDLIL
jgi:hypothetical protein